MKVHIPQGFTDVWKLYRHCCCRFGSYPLLVAPLVTCACFLDLYSSSGCDFIRMDIGFTPQNELWLSQNANLGLFSFDSHEVDANKWKRSLNNGCQSELQRAWCCIVCFGIDKISQCSFGVFVLRSHYSSDYSTSFETTYINASVLDLQYKQVNDPVVFDW